VPRLSPKTFQNDHYNCICVCRPLENDILSKIVTKKWKDSLFIIEDDAILDSSLDAVTSRHVREKIKIGQSIDYLVGRKVEEYVIEKRLKYKVIHI
jgi:nicotinic acid mononucleotide adenylyltransferase